MNDRTIIVEIIANEDVVSVGQEEPVAVDVIAAQTPHIDIKPYLQQISQVVIAGMPSAVSVTTPGQSPVAVDINIGQKGDPGDTGPEGPPGIQGSQGDQGIAGPIGPEGAAGTTGVQGPMGPQGSAGPQGSVGTGITMKGSVATSGNLPTSGNAQGDAYIVQADDSLWIWDGTKWVSGGSIQGPPGIQGPQGGQGAQGATGPAGGQGVPGPIGPMGSTGPTGPPGPVGEAPLDGQQYARRSASWVVATGGGGGSGALITGVGPPADAVGDIGQIYLDTDTGAMYGPKQSGGATGPQTNHGSQTTTAENSSGTPWYYGNKWLVKKNLSISQLRAYRASSGTATNHTAQLWNIDTGVKLTEVVLTKGTAAGWYGISITPVSIAANTNVAVIIETAAGGKYPSTSPLATEHPDDVVLNGATDGVGSTSPTTLYINASFWSDFTYQLEGTGPGPADVWPEIPDPGGSGGSANYVFNAQTAAPPGNSQVRLNNASQAAATTMWITNSDADSIDRKFYLLYTLKAGQSIYFQQSKNAANWQIYRVTADAIDSGSYVTVPIAWQTGGAAVPAGACRLTLLSEGGGGGASVIISDTPPAGPTVGTLWFQSSTGSTFIWYNDGDTTQWVQTAPGGGVQGAIATDAPNDGNPYIRQSQNWALSARLVSVSADMSAMLKASPNRFVINDKPDGSGNDVMVLDDTGNLQVGPNIAHKGSPSIAYTKQKGTTASDAFMWRVTDDGTSGGANAKALLSLIDTTDTTLNLVGGVGNQPTFAFYRNNGSTRAGYIQSGTANLTINGDAAGINVLSSTLYVGPRTTNVVAGCRQYISYLGLGTQYGLNLVAESASGTSTPIIFTFPPSTSVGTITMTPTVVAYNTSSDERLKDFSGPLTGEEAAAIIFADPARHFTWKLDGSPAVGWGAQTSHGVSPDLATPGDNLGPDAKPGDEGFRAWGIDQAKRTPYLWAALAHALEKIDALEARLALVEAR